MFIPLSDYNPLDHISAPWMTRLLMLVTVMVWIVFQAGHEEVGGALAFMLIPAVLFQGAELPENLAFMPESATLFSYAFLHGNFLHLAGNMLFLWVFGDNVEDALGHIKFLIFYLLCAAAGGIAHALSLPSSEAPLVGASGAVAGCVAAYLMLHPHVRVWVLVFKGIPLRIPAYWPLGFWVLMQIVNVVVMTEDNTAWWAHIGGLIAGAVLVVFMRRPNVRLFDRSQAL